MRKTSKITHELGRSVKMLQHFCIEKLTTCLNSNWHRIKRIGSRIFVWTRTYSTSIGCVCMRSYEQRNHWTRKSSWTSRRASVCVRTCTVHTANRATGLLKRQQQHQPSLSNERLGRYSIQCACSGVLQMNITQTDISRLTERTPTHTQEYTRLKTFFVNSNREYRQIDHIPFRFHPIQFSFQDANKLSK